MNGADARITTLWEGRGPVAQPQAGKPNERRQPASAPGKTMTDKYELLKDIPPAVVRKGWFTLAHLILDSGALVVDMGCDDGSMTYTMAAFNPNARFIGVDKVKRNINKARQQYQLPNLEYRVGDITKDIFDNGSVDTIVNSYVLHEIYSQSRFNERAVRQTLRNHAAMLKTGGLLFIHDFARPPPEEFVLMEMPDIESRGEELTQLSEADLLVWFSEHARPTVKDPGCSGFYLEELPPRFPRTRLFRLPYKWAYEFIMRKDGRETWETELPKEYTFFTKREFRKELRALGSRVLYSAPHWDDSLIQKSFEGHFRLYKDDGTPIGNPPTSFIAVAQKVGEGKSLVLEERRPSREKNDNLRLFAMRNEYDGSIVDIVTRDFDGTDVIPYRLNEHGGLNIFVHDGLPRGIVNAVPRQGQSLDGKRWSGHMVEALNVESGAVRDAERGGHKATIKFASQYFGIKPAIGTEFEQGPSFYPAPDYIDERIETRYLRIESGPTKPFDPKQVSTDAAGFSTHGRVREVDAQSILNAMSVGLIPNVRLETQILALYQNLGLKAETWSECPLIIPTEDPKPVGQIRELLAKMSEDDHRFKEAKGTAGQVRVMHSIFVDEGYTNGGPAGLVSKSLDFVMKDDGTINKAVVLPLTKNLQGVLMAGVMAEYMPVPQRYKGNGLLLSVPSFTLPKEIEDVDGARRFLADKLGIKPDNVSRLGQSFFTHTGLTPQRIYPFAATRVDLPAFMKNGRLIGRSFYTPLYSLWRLMYWDIDDKVIAICQRAYQTFFHETEMSVNLQAKFYYQQKKGGPLSLRAEELFSNDPARRATAPLPQTLEPRPISMEKDKDDSARESTSSAPSLPPLSQEMPDRDVGKQPPGEDAPADTDYDPDEDEFDEDNEWTKSRRDEPVPSNE
ncbi:MAG: class I SAM-dependent methyltransferase [Alphaproteobacteria bacterium]|nr:class I SAM-dependent methyltransferase [Alphaproteobacteria bacterium]